MPKKTTSVSATVAAAPPPICDYECSNGTWILVGGNPPAGYYCPSEQGACTPSGATQSFPAEPIPPELASMTSNSGVYVYNRNAKSLFFTGGSCGKGKHFKPVIPIKELAKVDAEAAELIKSMHKNKRIASFSVVLKAQKT